MTTKYEERTGIWHVHGHAEALRVLTDPTTFSSDMLRLYPDVGDSFYNDGNLLQLDGDAHRKLRRLVSQAFTPRTVADLEPRIHALTTELLAAADERGALELVADLAYPLPVTVIAELLGVPASDRDLFREWAAILFEDTDVNMNDDSDKQLADAQSKLDRLRPMFDYIAEHAGERRRRPRVDLLTRLVEAEVDGERLSDQAIGSFTSLLLAAGHVTTALLLGNTVLCLDENPGYESAVRADRTLLPAVIEETLRLRTPLTMMARVTTAATSVGDQRIPANQMVMVSLNEANRDPLVFTDPDRFDPSRDPNPHLAFGKGAHFCVGAPLARLEARVALTVLLDRYPALRTTPDDPPVPVDSPAMTGVQRLPLITR